MRRGESTNICYLRAVKRRPTVRQKAACLLSGFLSPACATISRKIYHGFTLIELLAVMAIISLLAAMLLPVLQKSLLTARTAACMSNLKQMGIAAHAYADENSQWLPYNSGWDMLYTQHHLWGGSQVEAGMQHWYGIGLLWENGWITPAVAYCPAADNLALTRFNGTPVSLAEAQTNSSNYAWGLNLKHPNGGVLWKSIPSNGRGYEVNRNVFSSYFDRQADYLTDRGVGFPSSMMRNLRNSSFTCPGVYDNPLPDVGYLYCEPSAKSGNPDRVASFHRDTTPVLMRSGRVVSWPMHPLYHMEQRGNALRYNGWFPNCDAWAADKRLRPPKVTYGRY